MAHSQTPPGSLEEFRLRLEQAAGCYDLVDYRCVISELEGPLLVRDALPEGVAPEEVELAYELLGLGYLSVGLDAEGRRTFGRLLELRPDYELARTDASPAQVALVKTLRAERDSRELASDLAAHVRGQAETVAATPAMKQRAVLAAVRFSAVGVAGAVVRTAEGVALTMSDPPMGPLTPWLEVGASTRILFGDDAQAWAPGVGVSAAVGLDYLPVYFALLFSWTRHASLIQNSVLVPPPPMDANRLLAEVGYGWRWPAVALRLGLVGGVEWLHVTESLQSINPTVGLRGGISWRAGAGFSLDGYVDGVWTFGQISDGEETKVGTSFSTGIHLGVGYSF